MVFDRMWMVTCGPFFRHLMAVLYSLSKKHKDEPWGMDVHGQRYEVNYWPGDSKSGMFGGNSNWRGPICKFYFSICWMM